MLISLGLQLPRIFLLCLLLGLLNAVLMQSLAAFVTTERRLVGHEILKLTESTFNWSLAAWMSRVAEFKS